jgi:hypothetical protein
MTLAPTCFGSHGNHPEAAVQYLAKNYKYGSSVLAGNTIHTMHIKVTLY